MPRGLNLEMYMSILCTLTLCYQWPVLKTNMMVWAVIHKCTQARVISWPVVSQGWILTSQWKSWTTIHMPVETGPFPSSSRCTEFGGIWKDTNPSGARRGIAATPFQKLEKIFLPSSFVQDSSWLPVPPLPLMQDWNQGKHQFGLVCSNIFAPVLPLFFLIISRNLSQFCSMSPNYYAGIKNSMQHKYLEC